MTVKLLILGLPLLVAFASPLERLRGSELVIRIAYGGDPVSGATIALLAYDSFEGAARSEEIRIGDQNGRARFDLGAPGYFVIKVELHGFIPVQLGPFSIDSFEKPHDTVLGKIIIELVPTISFNRVGSLPPNPAALRLRLSRTRES